ncbi:MAG TPA: vitamin K epoxide reductase family protein [Candidatus Baltobacteraceae bacterium]|jgi:uncharacterized membrane protein
MGLRLIITALCAIGLYASVFMLRKTRLAERGKLTERSVVQTERARLFGATPNALVGIAYYVLFAAAAWTLSGSAAWLIAEAAAIFAALTSAYLAYSLLFVTRMSCPYCWTAHAVNWLLPILGLGLLAR